VRVGPAVLAFQAHLCQSLLSGLLRLRRLCQALPGLLQSPGQLALVALPLLAARLQLGLGGLCLGASGSHLCLQAAALGVVPAMEPGKEQEAQHS
jgi:hypothetical protein